MSFIELLMLTSGITLIVFAVITTLFAIAELFWDWKTAIGAIFIVQLINALGCLFIWGALK